VSKWLLPTLSEVVALSDPTWMVGNARKVTAQEIRSANGQHLERKGVASPATKQLRAEREWTGAIAALNELLNQFLDDTTADTIDIDGTTPQYGFVLSGPSPILSQPNVVEKLSTWTLASPAVHSPHWIGFQLLPAEMSPALKNAAHPVLPLLPGDPLGDEQFCLVLTPWFSLVIVLGEMVPGEPTLMFSFAPDAVQTSWEAVRPRILLMSSHQVDFLDDIVAQFPPVTPDFKTVTQFSRLMLDCLPESGDNGRGHEEVNHAVSAAGLKPNDRPNENYFGQSERSPRWQEAKLPIEPNFDVELVKALAHEVRTPLTTIRTLTRSLLKRVDLPADVLRRLGIIDRECSEQIDRFGLIFKAVELESTATHKASMSLIRTCLSDVFQQSIPRWQQSASQRQMTLTVDLPQEMPTVVSDPTVLDQALTSLIERFTRNLPAGSHIQVEVTPAGSQLKVQLQSQPDKTHDDHYDNPFNSWKSSAKAIGQMLMFQPETGCLSLNLNVTKNLFQAIGGKLIVKQRPQQGEVMTVYLPLEVSGISPLDGNKIITV